MFRLLWLSSDLADPEARFSALTGYRPAPEPLTFAETTGDLLARRLLDAVLVDGRGHASEAAALIRKLVDAAETPMIVMLHSDELNDFDWSCRVNDFMTGDVSRAELDARIARVVAPPPQETDEVMRRGPLTINRERFEVRAGDDVLPLTFKEFELLAYLAARPGRVCSRSTLLSEVWAYDFFGGTRTVDVHVRRLRAKLGNLAHVIETVRHVGYRFNA